MKKPRISREALVEKIRSTEAFKKKTAMREEAARAALPILADLHENGLDLESLSELRESPHSEKSSSYTREVVTSDNPSLD